MSGIQYSLMTKNHYRDSKDGKEKSVYSKWREYNESKDKLKSIASFAFAFAALLLLSSVASSSVASSSVTNNDVFAQTTEGEEVNKSDAETAKDDSTDRLSSEDGTGKGSQPITIGDLKQESRTDELAVNLEHNDANLDGSSQLKDDVNNNDSTSSQKGGNPLAVPGPEISQSGGNTAQKTIVPLTANNNTVLQATNHATSSPLNSTAANTTLGLVESSKGIFIVKVEVTNNSPNPDRGRISVKIDGNPEKTISTQFPAKKTIAKAFEFKEIDVPVGKGFTVKVEPENSNSATAHGVNSPAKKPEGVKLAIGQGSTGEGKFRVVVKVTNTATTDYKGGLYVIIDNGPSQSQHGITFPAKKTIQRTFEFDSRYVPVGKGFTAEVVWDDDYDRDVKGVNSPKKGPETVEVRIS
jgi:hypothetical protein